ncbi:MAG: ankyrin repeat domain-containing protein [Candidatus Paceibacterota bacterium]
MSRYDTLREAVVSDDFELFLETHLGILNITANDSDYNLLHFSILSKQYKCVEWLLQNGADPEIRNHYGRTCIEEAMMNPPFDPVMIKIVAKHTGFNINAYDKNGHTYLHQRICSGDLSILPMFYNSQSDDFDFYKPTQYGLSTIDLLMCTLKNISDSNIRPNRIKFIESIYEKEEIFIFANNNKNKQSDPPSVLRCFCSFIYDIFNILFQQKKNNNSYKMLIKIMNQPRNREYIRNKVSGYDFFSYLLIESDLNDNNVIDAIICLIYSGIFNIKNINDSGLNIFQFIIKNCPTSTNFLVHFLDATTHKSNVLNILSICKDIGIPINANSNDTIDEGLDIDINDSYKNLRRSIKSYISKDVFLSLLELSSFSSKIIQILNSISFPWNKIINPGEIIPFQCCNLFVWALKNDIPLAKFFLADTNTTNTTNSKIDWNSFIMTNYCQSNNNNIQSNNNNSQSNKNKNV